MTLTMRLYWVFFALVAVHLMDRKWPGRMDLDGGRHGCRWCRPNFSSACTPGADGKYCFQLNLNCHLMADCYFSIWLLTWVCRLTLGLWTLSIWSFLRKWRLIGYACTSPQIRSTLVVILLIFRLRPILISAYIESGSLVRWISTHQIYRGLHESQPYNLGRRF